VPVATASRLFIDVALFWQHAGDLRMRDHWLAGASRDVDATSAARWAKKLGPSVVSRVGYLAERFGARALAAQLAPNVARRATASFGPRGKGAYNSMWHIYDSIGIGRSK
jgi:predicted transcriptional regulator of viral defense system